jgi:hypothetical protein
VINDALLSGALAWRTLIAAELVFGVGSSQVRLGCSSFVT